MKNRAKWNNANGFSLIEMMVTVMVIVVLCALAMIPISKMQKDIRQTELDSRAEMIFTAVQNRMTRLQAAGQSDVYKSGKTGVKELGITPADADEARTLVYVTSDSKADADSAASRLYPETEAEAELWNGSWVVEYDAKGGSVYAVFYSREPMAYKPDDFNKLRSRSRRISEGGAKIGYYGGDSVGAAETNSLTLTVKVINQEKLQIVAKCKSPRRGGLKFYATVTDESGHTAKDIDIGDKSNGDSLVQVGKNYTATLTLDDLSEGKRFGEQDRFKDLIPGENLTVTIRAKAVGNPLIEDARETKTVNSLFAGVRENGTDRTAIIRYGRHLQNLELEKSGLKKENDRKKIVTAAVQETDISFGASWALEYETRKFTPIENAQLKSYESTGGMAIYDLPVETTGDAGLFKTFTGTLKNIRLVDAKITGEGTVGGLVGKLTGETTIDGCQVYLKNVKDKNIPKDEIFTKHTRIGGTVVGGLVGSTGSTGSTEGNTLTIRDSLAATVIRGQTAAGGLIGNGEGTLTVEGSYADCYISSNGNAGGLIGNREIATNDLTIQNCYTAGFLEGNETAGLVVCDLSSNTLGNVYSACATLKGESLTYGTARKTSGTSGNGKITKVYYLSETKDANDTIGTKINYQELSTKNPVELLSNAFTKQNGDTHAYNLMSGLGLSQYSYPRLAKLPHYGDWQAKFEDNALVYYEWYGGDDYGFFGANISALSDKPVKGDGYGMIYETLPKTDVTVTVNDQPYKLKPEKPEDAITITVTDKNATKTYYLLPLPKELVQEVAEVPQADGKPSFYTKLTAGGKDYYYNPHFASTAVTDGSKAPTQISIRTARQLYALSEYYDKYVKILPDSADFQQGCDIDYGTYVWKDYGKGGKAVTEQKPIGRTETTAFQHSYDGGSHIITRADAGGLSFVSEVGTESSAAVGLFGFVTGTLENIVVTTDQALDTAPTSKLGGSVQRRTVYIGVLAGQNSGRIYNCAVSGYKLSCYAYSGSTCYIGGLVGYNEGTVSACGAAIPSISGNTTNARGYYAGALAGVNAGGGYIRQSYALGSIELWEIRGSAVISGFVGDNQGTIRNSYCATALSAVTGAEVNGFASAHGSVSNCYYLSGGTYTFAGTVRLYDYEPGASGAEKKTHEEMQKLELSGFSKVDETKNHPNTPNTEVAEGTEAVYPYVGSVSGPGGTVVHYGDWPTPADMGTIGMVYWEKEEGGANSGYHFSYIGFTENTRKAGSSLCTAHDDGGKITDFGYGYYKVGTDGSLTSWSDNFVRDGKNIEDLDGKNNEAAAALAQQVSGYTFTCYQTGEKGLRLSAETNSRNGRYTLAANGTWKLTQGTQTYEYAVCPFFGDAFCPVEDVDNDAQNLGKTKPTKKKQYQIRSVEQLQFINWSCEVTAEHDWTWEYHFTFNTGTGRPVTSETYQQFPYLQYKTMNKNQTRADAEENRPQRSWTQTHDLNGANTAKPTDGTQNTEFHPIAGAVINNSGYDVTLYAWFGGEYNGGNYYIKNIAINSNCYNVGVFGTTAGADIRNIVLYSDNGGVIQRSSDVTGSTTGTTESRYQCAYALGGLAGIAYEYADERETSGAVIQNCAIAGYQIQDNSQNKLGLGEAVVGGLIGVSSLELNKCSAVVDIEINCTHLDKDGALDAPKYGNFVRVGGLVGGVRGKVSNCYTGGSITVSEDTLKERVVSGKLKNLVGLSNKEETVIQGRWQPATFVYLGGIGGSGFSSTLENFGGAFNGSPDFQNCYTYMSFPAMRGTITAISLIGSVADRYGRNFWTDGKFYLTINNCYYLESSANIDFSQLPKFHAEKNSLTNLLGDDSDQAKKNRDDMLKGRLDYLGKYAVDGANSSIYVNSNTLTSLTYEQMSNQIGREGFIKVQNGSTAEYTTFRLALNKNKEDGPFGWVTNVENSSTIHGKYSFPGGDTALQGQDYPFPTVLTQKDSLGKPVNLHYSAWPKVGMFWSQGIVSMDLIADYNKDVPNKSAIKLELNLSNLPDTPTGSPTFTYTDEGVVTAEAVQITEGSHKGDFEVTLTGEGIGATEVIAKYNGYTARLMVAVRAELTVDLKSDLESDLVKNNRVELTLNPPKPGGTGDPAGEDPSTEGPPEPTPPTSGEGGETPPPEPAPPAYEPSDPVTVTLKLVDKNGKEITAGKPTLTWEAFSKDPAVATCEVDSKKNTITVTGLKEGETRISITATYTLNGKPYTAATLLRVTVTQPETGGGGTS